jgi:hypothetical protein
LLPASFESGAKLSKRNRSISKCEISSCPAFARHVAIELVVDDLYFVAGECAAVFVVVAEHAVVE